MRKKKKVVNMDEIPPVISTGADVTFVRMVITTYNVIDQTDEYYIVEGKDKETIAMRKCECRVVTISGLIR